MAVIFEELITAYNHKIVLRPVNAGDAAYLKDLFEFTLSDENIRLFVAGVKARRLNRKAFVLGIEDRQSKHLVGVIEVYHVIDGSGEIGYRIHPEYRNMGYAKEAVKVFTKLLVSQYGFKELYAQVKEGNRASEKVLMHNGYVYEETRDLLKRYRYKGN